LDFPSVDPSFFVNRMNSNNTFSHDNGSKIKVLVCTANMGNEEPNCESLSSWIPNDGDTKSVLENQSYPVRGLMKEKFQLAATAILGISKNEAIPDVEAVTDYVVADTFDIIAIGMQEATFEVSEETYHSTFSKKLLKMTGVVEKVTKNENYQEEKLSLKYLRNKLTSKRNLAFRQSTSSSGPETLEEENKDDVDPDRGQDDTRVLHQMLQERLPSYTRAVSYQRGQMRMMIFYNDDAITLDVLSVKAQNTGIAGLANKGGIVAECDINSGTRISFLSAHLEAHEGISKYNTRCSTIGDILGGTATTVSDSYCDASMTSHFMFVMGDLNFRTRLPDYEIGSDEHIEEAHYLTEKKDWKTLNENDELSLALTNKKCLVGFSTPRCDFPPTFKVERRDGYSYIPKRSPSYTDRIVYKANHRLSEMINLQAYEPIDHFTTSDHKPIRGAFEIELNSTLRWRPMLKKGHKSFRYFARSSGRKVRGFKTKKLPKFDSGSKSENLHLFISSLECNIEQGPLPVSVFCPSPCVSFLSTPSNAIITEVVTMGMNWKSWYNKQSQVNQVKMRWPHTKSIPNTLNPKWEGETNLKVRTHDATGRPLDLTGAMLHVIVLDNRENLKLLGSCTLNLASLIRASRDRRSVASQNDLSSEKRSLGTKPSLAISFAARLLGLSKLSKEFSKVVISDGKTKTDSATNDKTAYRVYNSTSGKITSPEQGTIEKTNIPKDPSTTVELSIKNNPSSIVPSNIEISDTLKKEEDSSAVSSSFNEAMESSCLYSSSDMINFLQINEDLVKNGEKVGTIKFNMDSWWLDEGSFDNLARG